MTNFSRAYFFGPGGGGGSFTARPEIPTPGDDTTQGFEPGSQLYSTDSLTTWLCVDATAGAAIWERTNFFNKRNLWEVAPTFDNTVWLRPGLVWTLDGTISTPAIVPGGVLRDSLFRTRFTMSVGNTNAGVRSSAFFFRGSVAGQGGVRLMEAVITNNTDDGVAQTQAMFCGFTVNFLDAGWDPTTAVNLFGFGKRGAFPGPGADTEWHIVRNDGAGAPDWTSLGLDFPADDQDAVFLMRIYWNETNAMRYEIERLDVPAFASGAFAVNVPDLDTLMVFQLGVSDVIAGTFDLDMGYIRIEGPP